jgi:hypothetical protein
LEICPVCKLERKKQLVREIVEGSSIPNNIDIFRVSNHPTIILATERFIEAIEGHNYVNISYSPSEIS